MLKLATVLDNPGEPQPETRYRDPQQLRALGYNGLVLYETTGLSGVESPEAVGTGEMRRWMERQFEKVGQTITRAHQAGLEVYLFYDVLSLAASVVERQPAALTCRNRPTTLCPGSEEALRFSAQALEALLTLWPQVSGVVLRFGDNDAARLPYLVGNDIYTPHCARCSQMGRVDRISVVLKQFHDLVVLKLNKRLIARAWNVRPNGMHDAVDLCQRLNDRLPGDPKDDRFVLSFKFTQTDFWRYQKWNPASLAYGERPIIYELQCQREFEGKGGVPNWQVPLWRDGYPEMADPGSPAGLANLTEKVHLAGLWAWVRGGGWGGPFVRSESWIDANVMAVPRLADHPTSSAAELADLWIAQRLRITDAAAAGAIRQALEHSPDIALRGFYMGPYARARVSPWHPNGDWIQDDLIDVQAAWRMIQGLAEDQMDQVVREKQEAVTQVAVDRAALQHAINDRTRNILEPLVNSLIYAESLFSALRDLLAGLVAYRRWQKTKTPALATACKQRLLAAQGHWNQHTHRHAGLAGTATAFREVHFWEVTQRILTELG
jgi:hypothetical protein